MSKVVRSQFIFLLIFLVGILGLFFYQRIFNQFLPPVDAPVVAFASEVKGSVSVRRFDQLQWQEAQDQTRFYSGDYILTQEQSGLKLTFADQTSVIELGENSFVRISRRKGKFLLEVKGGKLISSTSGDRVEIKQMEGLKGEMAIPEKTVAAKPSPSSGPQKPADPAENTKPDESSTAASPAPSQEPTKSQHKYSVSPKEGTVLMYFDENNTLNFHLNAKSRGTGKLVLTSTAGSKTLNFKTGQEVEGTWRAQDFGEGKVEWKYTDDKVESRGSFLVYKFSNKQMEEALKGGYPIEFLK